MIQKVLQAMVDDDPSILSKAVDELFPFTEQCVSYWGLTRGLYGDTFFTSQQQAHIASCEHCSGRIARMVKRSSPSLVALKAVLKDNTYGLLELMEKNAGVGCKLQIAALRLWTLDVQILPLPLARGASFAPADSPGLETSSRQMLDDVTEATLDVDGGELIVHVDSSSPRTIRLGLLPLSMDDTQRAPEHATKLQLRKITEQYWTATHSFGAARALQDSLGAYVVLAEVHHELI